MAQEALGAAAVPVKGVGQQLPALQVRGGEGWRDHTEDGFSPFCGSEGRGGEGAAQAIAARVSKPLPSPPLCDCDRLLSASCCTGRMPGSATERCSFWPASAGV